MYALTSPKDSNKISDELYNRFYDTEHIPDALQFFQRSGGVENAFALRYKNTNIESKLPFLALYPLPDAQFMFSPDQAKFADECKKSKVLEVDNFWEHIDAEVRLYEKIQTYEGYWHTSKSGKERGTTIVAVAMDPGENEEQETDLDDWYRKQHLDMMSMARNYRRSTRYKRVDGQKPRYLALHEYACQPDELPTDQITQLKETEWSKNILAACSYDRDVFELIAAVGETSEKL